MPTSDFCADCKVAEGASDAWRDTVAEAGEAYRQARDVTAKAKQRLIEVILAAKATGTASDRALAKTAQVSEMTIREWRGVRVRRNGKIVSN